MTSDDTTQGGRKKSPPITLPRGFNPARQDKTTPTRLAYAAYQPTQHRLDNAWRELMDLPVVPSTSTTEPHPAPTPPTEAVPAEHDDASEQAPRPDSDYSIPDVNDAEAPTVVPDGDYVEHDGIRHYHHLVKCGNGEYRATNAEGVELADSKGAAILVELTGDQACFPTDAKAMVEAISATDLAHERVRGKHFGGAITDGEPTGATLAANVIGDWLAVRFPLVN